VDVSAVSQPQSYLPIGLVHRRPTTAPVTPVRQDRTSTAKQAGAVDEDPGPKLLVDLSLIAPRSTEQAARATTSPARATTSPARATTSPAPPPDGADESERCALRMYQDQSNGALPSSVPGPPLRSATGEPISLAMGVDLLA